MSDAWSIEEPSDVWKMEDFIKEAAEQGVFQMNPAAAAQFAELPLERAFAALVLLSREERLTRIEPLLQARCPVHPERILREQAGWADKESGAMATASFFEPAHCPDCKESKTLGMEDAVVWFAATAPYKAHIQKMKSQEAANRRTKKKK